MPRRKRLTMRKYGGKKKMERRGDSLNTTQENTNEPRTNVATKPKIFGHIIIITEHKGEINIGSIENSLASFDENEENHLYESNLQYSEEYIKSLTTRADNFVPCLENSENNQPVFDDVDNISQYCETASQNAKESQTQEEKSKNHISRLDKFRNSKNSLVFSEDAINLLFLGLAQTVKTFSSDRQELTKLKIMNLVLEQEAEQQKEDMIFSPSLNKLLPL